MNQGNESQTLAHQPGNWGQALTVVVITPEDATFETLRQALDAGHWQCNAVHANDPATVISPDDVGPIVLYCLECDENAQAAQSALGLVRNIAGDTPVLMFDAGGAGLDTETAIGAGAWDLASLSEFALFEARLRRALQAGWQHLELADAGKRLNQAQRRLDVLLSHGQDARASLVDRHIVDPNAAFARLIGLPDVEAAKGLDVLERVAPHDRDRLAEALDQVSQDNTDTSLVFEVTSRLNHRQSVRALLQRGVGEDGAQRRVNMVLQPTDGDDSLRTEHNPNAPLDGRMALHALLAQTAGRAHEHMLGLVFIAIDDIAALQDQLGLAESDLLLQEVGLLVLQNSRGEDRCFRFGAGEYVMLVDRHSGSEIAEFTTRLHTELSNEVFGDEHRSASLTASMAHIALSGDGADNDRCLRTIMDTAYDTRGKGGNQCVDCSDVAGDAGGKADLQQWVARLHEALDQDRFSLAYQGITSLAGDSQPYFDVLLRYIDDRGALVRPGEFLPAAEQGNLMLAIDQWVIRRAVDVISQQSAKDAHIAMFVKLSAITIASGNDFRAWLEDLVKQRQIARHHLIFSLREDDVRGNTQAARKLATELDSLGFRVALTHYGSTPKSAQILDKMPAAFIKLAPDFARQMLGGTHDEQLAHIIASARERQIPLIAEQIEDANSMAHLWQAGVNYVQGHFIQEPDTEALAHSENRLT